MKSHNGGLAYSVTITTAPSLIKGVDIEPRNALVMANVSSQTIYIGYDLNVSTSNGFPLVSGERTSEELYHGNVYGIVSSGTAELRARTY